MIVAIVQARIGSSRLPGKVLMELNGHLVLDHVLARVRAIPGIERVCCAVPEGPANDPVAEAAQRAGAVVVRGDEQDVLARYLAAARATDADVVMRVTSDCPLLDPVTSGKVLSRQRDSGADYVSNVDPRLWPRGLDTEVFTRAALEQCARSATASYDREHVTPWMRAHPDLKRENVSPGHSDWKDWRWTLDYPQDLAFMRAVLAELPRLPAIPSFEALLEVIRRDPSLSQINAGLE